MSTEYIQIKETFFQLLKTASWCNYPRFLNKGYALWAALRAGLKIPDTLLTNQKDVLRQFRDKQAGQALICKAVGNAFDINIDNRSYLISPHLLSTEVCYQDVFFPSLVQQYINKDFDVRVFYINRKIYASAIFSQEFERTKVDFRINVQNKLPVRISPIGLPEDIRHKIIKLMEILEYEVGSLDLVFSGGEYIFLELNPSGQFGEYGALSGYNLYQVIANELIKMAEENGTGKK